MADQILDSDHEAALKKVFRRSSVEYGFIKATAMMSLLQSMGQKDIDEEELAKWIATLDSQNTGTLSYSEYNSICKRFLKDPIALQSAESDEFSFKNLMTIADFASH